LRLKKLWPGVLPLILATGHKGRDFGATQVVRFQPYYTGLSTGFQGLRVSLAHPASALQRSSVAGPSAHSRLQPPRQMHQMRL
jgi:hypothetical protein